MDVSGAPTPKVLNGLPQRLLLEKGAVWTIQKSVATSASCDFNSVTAFSPSLHSDLRLVVKVLINSFCSKPPGLTRMLRTHGVSDKS